MPHEDEGAVTVTPVCTVPHWLLPPKHIMIIPMHDPLALLVVVTSWKRLEHDLQQHLLGFGFFKTYSLCSFSCSPLTYFHGHPEDSCCHWKHVQAFLQIRMPSRTLTKFQWQPLTHSSACKCSTSIIPQSKCVQCKMEGCSLLSSKRKRENECKPC